MGPIIIRLPSWGYPETLENCMVMHYRFLFLMMNEVLEWNLEQNCFSKNKEIWKESKWLIQKWIIILVIGDLVIKAEGVELEEEAIENDAIQGNEALGEETIQEEKSSRFDVSKVTYQTN